MLDPAGIGRSQDRTTTVEKGAFAIARCTCGWSGPARRARAVARSDAAAHTTARHSLSGKSDSPDSSD